MAQKDQLSASLEDYLEAIYNIISEKGGVRVKDIAHEVGVKAGSVTTALQSLTKSGYINYKPYGVIALTSKGIEQAQEVIRRHDVLKDFFVEILGADPKEAEVSACKIEHVITDKLLNRLISFAEHVKSCPQCGSNMLVKLHGSDNKNSNSCNSESCQTCINKAVS